MQLTGFRVQMYKGILDSGWVEVSPLTVVVGKNEAGKTTLLKALHKFKPFKDEPYAINREWPRGHRREQNPDATVCTVRFRFGDEELTDVAGLTDQELGTRTLEVRKDYAGKYHVVLDPVAFPDRPHADEVAAAWAQLPVLAETVGAAFRGAAERCLADARGLADGGRLADLAALPDRHAADLRAALAAEGQDSRPAEEAYLDAYVTGLRTCATRLRSAPTIRSRASDFVLGRLPTFIYMDEYRAFRGTAYLDQVHKKKTQGRLDDEDQTLLMIMHLSGLSLDALVRQGGEESREERQYDLSDAGATLTREIADRWKQRRYEVDFRADGNQFMTFVRDERDPALLKLEERSKGFQWFFSFDLMLMHETGGTFKDCVVLLDEPGLHLHPDAQRDLLARLEAYAKGNTLIYTTHLPFMIDLRKPDRIRVLSETAGGTVVSGDLTQSQPEAKFVLQAALGMSGTTSYLLSRRNLVVEGVDDYWVVSELSNLLIRSGEPGLPDDLFVTPAGGASEAAYIATIMIGQKLEVAVLLDHDKSGQEARDRLVKNWLDRYQGAKAAVLSIGEAVGVTDRDFATEDLFPEDYYVGVVSEVYRRELQAAGVAELRLPPGGLLWRRVDRALEAAGVKFNKGPVAKVLRSRLAQAATIDALPEETRDRARRLVAAIRAVMPDGPAAAPTPVAAEPPKAAKVRGRQKKEGGV